MIKITTEISRKVAEGLYYDINIIKPRPIVRKEQEVTYVDDKVCEAMYGYFEAKNNEDINNRK